MSSPGGDPRKVVLAALAGNVAICASKFGAAWASDSAATLAEAVHSVADSLNQVLLLVGMRLAARGADDRFQFGRAMERYFWPFVVALMLFALGGAFGVYEGVHKLLRPPTAASSPFWSVAVLGASAVFESLSFTVAWREFRRMRGARGLREVLLGGKDPTIPLVLFEDTSALVGLGVALAAVGASALTGIRAFDAAGSVVIGAVLCVTAGVLAVETHGLLIGESADVDARRRVVALAEGTPGVERVTQLVSMHLGPDTVVLALKVGFRRGMPVEELEDTTNEIERRIRGEMPEMVRIFIEADALGDGRGLEKVRAPPGAGGPS